MLQAETQTASDVFSPMPPPERARSEQFSAYPGHVAILAMATPRNTRPPQHPPMTINAAGILRAVDNSGETVFSLLLDTQAPCKKIGIQELKALAVAGHVCARWRGGKIRSVQLIVPASVAFADATRIIRDSLHSAANQTTERSADSLPPSLKRHHAAHCSTWPTFTSRNYAGPVDARSM
jgi:hypothetical protein